MLGLVTWRLRSIPAHAGEPWWSWNGDLQFPVYPRPRGGTANLPASGFPDTVYPRPRGGTDNWHGWMDKGEGLSPPTRGNRRLCASSIPRTRSIPAHAGEPAVRLAFAPQPSVYPRPRGGTNVKSISKRGVSGLSPPTRGNLVQHPVPHPLVGSIPAHAGEPCLTAPGCGVRGVYPRPRGGTRADSPALSPALGLSPPTRGNHHRKRFACIPPRSIPAHAGEPYADTPPTRRAMVYPRPRGGTPATR